MIGTPWYLSLISALFLATSTFHERPMIEIELKEEDWYPEEGGYGYTVTMPAFMKAISAENYKRPPEGTSKNNIHIEYPSNGKEVKLWASKPLKSVIRVRY